MKKSEANYQFLGFFRFFLALLVLWSHSLTFFIPEFQIAKLQLGNVAVSSFFVLSGYLMFMAINNFYKEKHINFIINRYIRISPPLLIASIISITVHFFLKYNNISIFSGDEKINFDLITNSNAVYTLLSIFFPFNIIVSKIFLSSYIMDYTLVRYSWAIFVEIFFYWLIFFSYRFNFKFLISFISIFFFFISIDNLYFGYYNFLKSISFIYLFQWSPHFLTGVFLFSFLRREKSIYFLISLLLSIFQISLYAKNDFILVTSLYIITNILFFIIVFNNDALISSKNNVYLDKFFGNISYPIYINQYAFSVIILSLINYFKLNIIEYSFSSRIVIYLFYNLIIICTSKILIEITDYYTNNLRNKIRGRIL